jgi:hypothetical protein
MPLAASLSYTAPTKPCRQARQQAARTILPNAEARSFLNEERMNCLSTILMTKEAISEGRQLAPE